MSELEDNMKSFHAPALENDTVIREAFIDYILRKNYRVDIGDTDGDEGIGIYYGDKFVGAFHNGHVSVVEEHYGTLLKTYSTHYAKAITRNSPPAPTLSTLQEEQDELWQLGGA